MAGEIVPYAEQGATLTQWRPPEQVLAEAKQAATALTEIIKLKKNPVMFNGEHYLEFEDWQTVGKFYGCTVKILSTAYVEFGDIRGFEATAVVLDARQNEISRAESMCLSEEESWGKIAKYEWQDVLDDNGKKIWVEGKDGKKRPKANKVQVGEVSKPLFQLRSMAQTRAGARALRQVFAWVVVLAGYKPSVAEEMTGDEQFDEHDQGNGKKPPVTQPTRTSERKPAAQTTQAATQPATQGEQQPAGDEVSGIIKKASPAANGNLRLEVGEKVVVVPHDKIDGDMVPGKFIKFRGSKRTSEKIGDFWVLEGLRELSDVQEGETQPATEKKMDPETAALADELFADKPAAGKEAVQGMIDKGELKTASQLPATKAGTIGEKRRIRLEAMCNSGKEKNNGFNHDEIKKILQGFPAPIGPIEHIKDMPVDLYPQFEKWANGEEDWREFWKEDGND